MSTAANLAPHSGSATRFEANVATRDPAWVRRLLLGVGLTFFVVFLVLPLIVVFLEAFRKGWSTYFAALVEPDAASAIR